MESVVPDAGATGWIEVELTSADRKRFMAVGARYRPATWLLTAAVPLSALVPVLVFTADPGLAMLAGLVALGAWATVSQLVQRTALSETRDSGPVRMRGSSSGVELRARDSHSWVGWPAFERVLEDYNYVFLMLTKSTGYTVPKRCFPSRETADAFAELARRNIDDGGPLETLEPGPERPLPGL